MTTATFVEASFATQLLRDTIPVFDAYFEKQHKQTLPQRPLYRFAPQCRFQLSLIIASRNDIAGKPGAGASDRLSRLMKLLENCVKSRVFNDDGLCDKHASNQLLPLEATNSNILRKLQYLRTRIKCRDCHLHTLGPVLGGNPQTRNLSSYIHLPSTLDLSHSGAVICTFTDYVSELQSNPRVRLSLDAPAPIVLESEGGSLNVVGCSLDSTGRLLTSEGRSLGSTGRLLSQNYRHFVDTLYDILVHRVECEIGHRRESHDSIRPHAVNLSLSCAKSYDYIDNGIEIEVTITNHNNEWRSCRFSQRTSFGEDKISVKLCELLDATLSEHETLHLDTDGKTLWHGTSSSKAKMDYATHEPCSLHDHLDHGAWSLLLVTKRKLMLIIARAVAQLYGSSWIHDEWRRHSILFFPAKNGETPNFVLPFLSVEDVARRGDESQQSPSPRRQLNKLLNCGVPVLRQLGILLVEIEKGTSIKMMPHESRLGENDDAAEDLIRATTIYEKLAPTLYGRLRGVIDLCLYSNGPATFRDLSSHTPEEICRLLDTYIVKPLEEDLNNVIHPQKFSFNEPEFWQCDKRHLELRAPRTLPGFMKEKLAIKNPANNAQNMQPTKPGFWDYGLAQKDQTNYESVNGWFELYQDRVLKMLDSLEGKAAQPRLKIAVLDSCIDRSRPNLLSVGSRLKEVKKFYRTSDEAQSIGHRLHGSHVVALVHRMAPFADVYVAEVASSDNTLSDDVITEALRHAVETPEGWKADLVVMAFGWYTDRGPSKFPKFKEALNENSEPFDPPLFFAAASNGGGNFPRTYPATKSSVFAIHATNHYGDKPTPNFNPTGEADRKNYSTIGHEVPGDSDDFRVSGTSFATPVAAGLAASIIELFRRQPKVPSKKFRYLKTYNGMSRVFDSIAVDRDHRYHHLEWASLFNGSSEEITAKILAVI